MERLRRKGLQIFRIWMLKQLLGTFKGPFRISTFNITLRVIYRIALN